MNFAKRTFLIESVSAFGAGAAWIAWMSVNAATRGALDSAESANLARLGGLLMVAQNLLLVPAALVLYERCAKKNPRRALQITVCGIVSLVF